jgi:hypothetical protein
MNPIIPRPVESTMSSPSAGIRRAIWLVLVLAVNAIAQPGATPPPGGWSISTDGELISLSAAGVSFPELMSAIQDVSPVRINVDSLPDYPVTVRYENVSLDELLSKLGISYYLTYSRDEAGGDLRLEQGWIGHFDPKPATPAGAGSGTGSEAPPSFTPDELTKALDAVGTNQLAAEQGVLVRAPFPLTVKLDGNLNDWPAEIPWQTVTHDRGINGPTNDADASFQVASVADLENLFLAFKIRDDEKVMNPDEARDTLNEDALELFLGNLVPAAADGAQRGIPLRRHHVWRVGQDGKVSGSGRQYVTLNNGLKAWIIDGSNGWMVELSVPLSSLGVKPEDQAAFSFNARLYDDDDGGERDHTLVWSRAERTVATGARPGQIQLMQVKP